MKTSLQFLTILITLACFACSANAQDQPSAKNIALAEELVSVMHMEEGMNLGMGAMKQMQSKMLDSSTTNSTTDIKERVQKSMEAGFSTATTFMTPEKMHAMYVSVYASTFTAEELQGAIDFYKSPIGQKWVEKQPQVSMAIMAKTTEMMMAAQPQIMNSVKKSMDALDALRKSTNSILSNFLPASSASSPGPTN